MNRTLLSLILTLTLTAAWSQQTPVWTPVAAGTPVTPHKAVGRASFPAQYKLFSLNIAPLRDAMMSVVGRKSSTSALITLPNADGASERFEITEASNFAAALQAQFPQIRAFSGRSLDDPGAVLKISTDGESIQTMVFRNGRENEYTEPYSNDKKVYAVFKAQRKPGQLPWLCSTADQALANNLNNRISAMAVGSNGVLRTMRLAQSCNGEYSRFFGATSSADEAKVLAAFNNTLTRCNGVYEKDLALHLNLIPETTKVIYYDPATDPYSTTLSSWNKSLQTTLTSVIGEANYDIGHLFGASGGGGNAGCIGCVCVDGSKGSGITSPADGIPQGDNFDIDYVAHEVGHQLGGNHTFSHTNEGSGRNKEVGSGITVMGYAGITSQDVAKHSIDIFHQTSIEQILANLSGKTCPVLVTVANTPPVVNSPGNFTIPISTPFTLTGSATDDAGQVLSYCWEQNDNASSTQTGTSSVASPTKATGPNWISFPAISTPSRTFPRLATILAGSNVTGPLTGGDAGANTEALSSVSRTLNFRLTVRDNVPYSSTTPMTGQTNYADAVVTVTNTAGPFAVTYPNTAITWDNGTTQNVTWSVNNTNVAPVNCTNVNILLSTDGGQTFSLLAANTPNDGSEPVTINLPSIPQSQCRIKVEAVGNIFFDIGNANFTVSTPPACGTPAGLVASSITNTSATVSWTAVTGAISYNVEYKLATASTWIPLAAQAGTSANLSGLTLGTLYDWRVSATCSAGTGSYGVGQFTTTGGTNACPGSADTSTNGTLSGASQIQLNTDVKGLINISGDLDYYKFVITTGGTITITLSTLPADYNLFLFNSAGSQLASSKKTGINSESIPVTVAAGTYYAQVVGNKTASNATSCYTLKVATGTAARNDISSVTGDEAMSAIREGTLQVYPNPADQSFELSLPYGESQSEVLIQSAQGKRVMSSTVNGATAQIDISGLPSGMYIILVRDGKGKTYRTRLVKQ